MNNNLNLRFWCNKSEFTDVYPMIKTGFNQTFILQIQ